MGRETIVDTFVNVFYQKFFLRDVLGKVAPGCVVCLTLVQALDIPSADLLTAWHPAGWVRSFVEIALFYLIGVTLQVTGELLGLLSASPKPHHILFLPVGWLRQWPACRRWWQINEDYAERLMRLRGAQLPATITEHDDYLSAIKEGTGNLSLALFVVAAVSWWSPPDGQLGVVTALVGIAFLLWSSQLLLAKRQARFEITVLARLGILGAEEASAMGREIGLKGQHALLSNRALGQKQPGT